MISISEYIRVNQSVSFDVLPLNEVDLICINELAYLPLELLMQQQDALTIELLNRYYQTNKEMFNPSFMVTTDRLILLENILESKRFAELRFLNIVNDVSQEFEKQFAAMICHIGSINHWQVIYRGTDDSMVGWKEDFKMTYMSEIPAQRAAVTYLESFLQTIDDPIYVTGHSKGGNLAIYASSQQSIPLQNKIKGIFIFDAPGFAKPFLSSEGYLAIRDRIIDIRPKESIVGVMLHSLTFPLFVEATQAGMLQHAVTTWQVSNRGHFILSNQTDFSITLGNTFDQWVTELSRMELKTIVDTFFDSFIDNGIISLDHISEAEGKKQFLLALNQLNHLENSKKELMQKSLKLLIGLMVRNLSLDWKLQWQVDDWLTILKK